MTDERPRSRLLLDVAAYVAARLVLVVVVAAVILGIGALIGLRDFPVVVALMFAIVIALPLGIWLFAPLRRRATESIAAVDERRRAERAQLQARLRGDNTSGPGAA
ncbi:membrane protein [Mycobacterium sp. SWH-M1]|nr:membrane protein [Mycobacterium sp. SWH-M1]